MSSKNISGKKKISNSISLLTNILTNNFLILIQFGKITYKIYQIINQDKLKICNFIYRVWLLSLILYIRLWQRASIWI